MGFYKKAKHYGKEKRLIREQPSISWGEFLWFVYVFMGRVLHMELSGSEDLHTSRQKLKWGNKIPAEVLCVVCAQSLSQVWLSVTPWTVARQAPLSMEFSRQEYWSGLLLLCPGNLPDPGIEPTSLESPALVCGYFTTNAAWEAPKQWLANRKYSIGTWKIEEWNNKLSHILWYIIFREGNYVKNDLII